MSAGVDLRQGRAAGMSLSLPHIAAAVLVGLATSMSMQLLNLRLQSLGASGSLIGLSAAIQAAGIIAAAPLTRRLLAFAGVRAVVITGGASAGLIFTLFGFVEELWLWSILRFLFAFGIAFLFTVSEYVVVSCARDGFRGQSIGWYATALAVGTAVGPLFVALVGVQGSTPFLLGALLFLLATVPVFIGAEVHGSRKPVVYTSNLAILRASPVIFLSAFIFGVADNGGLGLISVYGALSGYDLADAASIAAYATLGAILLQYPIGRSTDLCCPRLLLSAFCLCSIFLLVVLQYAILVKSVAFLVALLVGGLLEGIYTVGLICLARRYSGQGLCVANACFVSMCGLGEVAGPVAIGTGMEQLGAQGFVIVLAALLWLYTFAINRPGLALAR